jgi:hypothetical protein
MAIFDVVVEKRVVYMSYFQIDAESKAEAQKKAQEIVDSNQNIKCDVEEWLENPRITVTYSI